MNSRTFVNSVAVLKLECGEVGRPVLVLACAKGAMLTLDCNNEKRRKDILVDQGQCAISTPASRIRPYRCVSSPSIIKNTSLIYC